MQVGLYCPLFKKYYKKSSKEQYNRSKTELKPKGRFKKTIGLNSLIKKSNFSTTACLNTDVEDNNNLSSNDVNELKEQKTQELNEKGQNVINSIQDLNMANGNLVGNCRSRGVNIGGEIKKIMKAESKKHDRLAMPFLQEI